MQSKHTPGPWRLVRNGALSLPDDPLYWGIEAGVGYCDEEKPSDGFSITAVISPANARLIAAAPTMLDALEAVIERFDFGMVPEMPRLESQVRAAIAIAKGEQ